jgi:hypothetical protein
MRVDQLVRHQLLSQDIRALFWWSLGAGIAWGHGWSFWAALAWPFWILVSLVKWSS